MIKKIIAAILGVILMAGGYYLHTTGKANKESMERFGRWPKMKGIVLESEVAPDKSGKKFAPRVEYSYTISGREYKGNRIYLGKRDPSFKNQDEAAAFLEKFPAESEIDVLFDPVEPTNSGLIIVDDDAAALKNSVGIVLMGFGLISLVLFLLLGNKINISVEKPYDF